MSTGEASLGAGPAPVGQVGDGGAWSDLAPHPVRRWIARGFDFYVTTGLVFAAVAAPWAVFGAGEARFLPLGIVGLLYLLTPVRGVVTAVLNAALLDRFATTPGKWLCGVRIVRKDGAPLDFGLAFRRELAVLAFGCGGYIPLVGLVAMGAGFVGLRKAGAAGWDEARGLLAVQRPNGAGQVLLASLAFTVLATLVLAMLALAFLLKSANGAAAG